MHFLRLPHHQSFTSILAVLSVLLIIVVPTAAQTEEPAAEAQSSVCGDEFTAIYEIQGFDARAAITGNITTQGVVTGDFQSRDSNAEGELDGFYIQDPLGDGASGSSDGIFVFDGRNLLLDVQPGMRVQVTGIAQETFNQTQITALAVVDCGITETVTPTDVTLPVPDVNLWEQFEGMLVTVSAAEGDLTATEHFNLGRYGEVSVSSGGRLYQFTHLNPPSEDGYTAYLQEVRQRSLLIDDANRNTNRPNVPHMPPPAPGEVFRSGYTTRSITGILGFGFEQYRLQPTLPIDWDASANPRLDAPPALEGRLRIAAFNVLNYFNGNGRGGGFPTPRGAHTAAEFTRQRDKTFAALVAMDADVIGLMEIENDSGANTALEDLVNGLNAIAGAGTYAFVDTSGRLGDDEIRVAILYRPAAVTPVGTFMTDDAAIWDRVPLAQTFEENSTGERFTVIVNHFKSKSAADARGTDIDQGDGQAAYNARRTQQAEQLLVFINDTVLPTSADEDVLIIGDLNAYAMEDPITTLTSAGFDNLIARYMGEEAYSFIRDGQAGYLDHALASESLLPQVAGAVEWHINADEPRIRDYNTEFNPGYLYTPDPFRSSDHDPVLVGLDLAVQGEMPDGTSEVTPEMTVEGTVDTTEETTPEASATAPLVVTVPTSTPAPTEERTVAPTEEVTVEPTTEATVEATPEATPTEEVTAEPTAEATDTPDLTGTETPPANDTPLIVGLIVAVLAVLAAALGLNRSRK